jgi:hypothetical protein
VIWLVRRGWLPLTLAAGSALSAELFSRNLPGLLWQNPLRSIVAGGVAFVLGVVVVVVRARRGRGYRREEDLAGALSLPVLAVVPVMTTRIERRARVQRVVVGTLIGVLVLGGSVAAAWWRLRL